MRFPTEERRGRMGCLKQCLGLVRSILLLTAVDEFLNWERLPNTRWAIKQHQVPSPARLLTFLQNNRRRHGLNGLLPLGSSLSLFHLEEISP